MTTNVLAGHAVNNTVVNVSFPTGDTVQDKHGRITAAIITLQNLNGPGKGCPGVSTTLGIQSNNLDACGDFECGGSSSPVVSSSTVSSSTVSSTANAASPSTPAPAASTSSAATATATGALTLDLVNQLAPDLGGQPNTNPNSAGDCDGPRQPNGQIPKVPCACPPLRNEYINQLFANIQAGHALNNPSVGVSFPTGNTVQDKHDRITAAVITLQNLNGPGKGCPTVSTTLPEQSNNLDQCGDFTCGGNSTSATTTSAPTVPPQAPATQAAVAIQDAASTVTVTVQTVVTSTVTVTDEGQGARSTPAPVVAAAVDTSTSTAAASTTTAASNGNGAISRELVDQLAPQLGSQPNNNPNSMYLCHIPRMSC